MWNLANDPEKVSEQPANLEKMAKAASRVVERIMSRERIREIPSK